MASVPRLIGSNILSGIGMLVAAGTLGRKFMLVYDDITWLAAGQQIHALLGEKVETSLHPLGREVVATMERAKKLIAAANGMDCLIAIGSGTVNDITKYAAAQLKIPYICVATAASMNGYTSANASLVADGIKQSFPAKSPAVVIADMAIVAAAPKRLARAGLGDTLCRSSVEIDAMLSHYLLGTPYPRPLFDKMRTHEAALITNSAKLTSNDPHDNSYFPLLMEALLDAGDAMSEFGSSAVASQGEHMIAHTAELMYDTELQRCMHGELVAVATLTSSNLQQQMLLMSQPTVKPLPRASTLFLRVFGKLSADRVEALYNKKLLSPEQAADINAIIAAKWPEMKQAMNEVMLSPTTVDRALILAGVPTRPHDLRLDPERYQHAVTYAHMERDRFTFLDLAAMNDKRA